MQKLDDFFSSKYKGEMVIACLIFGRQRQGQRNPKHSIHEQSSIPTGQTTWKYQLRKTMLNAVLLILLAL